MDSDPATASKKRNLGHMLVSDLMGKLKSKADFYDYLDKHGKYPANLCLTLLQSSSICQRQAPSTRTSSRRFSPARSSS